MRLKLLNIERNIKLSQLTTLGLGGVASKYVRCKTVSDIQTALKMAQSESWPVCVLGGGSNLIVNDFGFDGLVIHVAIQQREAAGEGALWVGGGELWDDFVAFTVEQGWTGVECLSGIPGYVGATPIQNVGAYGQEVSDTIHSVRVLDRQTLEVEDILNEDCDFSYRQSRFKGLDKNRFVVVAVRFDLDKKPIHIKYPELQKKIADLNHDFASQSKAKRLQMIRETVLELRRGKSMVVDSTDGNSKSVGSFFVNPVLNAESLQRFTDICEGLGKSPATHATEFGTKVSAAWLVENAGFNKGFRHGGVKISDKHSLALVNVSGKTSELLELADLIRTKVYQVFSIKLHREPVLLGRDSYE
ncbi:UDP-N-acetylmuramate dehydrogenase [Oligoflexaceae bacterium]|nr:UDP-N-acetylmuramate dehydrogenase [Oligoflexaceae bacterium]